MFEVFYTGKESHAAAHPELGINAADALTVAQTAIGLLRQHIRSTDRIHGISPPYTFFLLNGEIELNRYRKSFIQKML